MRWNFKRKQLNIVDAKEPLYRNPLFQKRTWQQFVVERFSFFVLLALLLMFGLVYLLFYSPVFAITTVAVQTNGIINTEFVKMNLVDWQLHQRRAAIYPQSNIFLFSKSWLKENIEKKYRIEDLSIKKKLPNAIIITIKEQPPALLWKTGELYYSVDVNGIVVRQEQTENVASDATIVQQEGSGEVAVGKRILSEDTISFILTLRDDLKNKTTVHALMNTLLAGGSSELHIKSDEGFTIYFDRRESLQAQMETLIQALNTTLADQRSKLQYIDVRIPGKVFYK